MAGLTVAQISEFSLILVTLGFGLGHLSRDVLTLVTMVGLVTIIGSTYFILYADEIFKRVERLLRVLELRKTKLIDRGVVDEKYDVILFGYDRVGEDFVRAFRRLGSTFMVVDYNPDSIRRLESEGLPHRFGDGEDPEFLEELNLTAPKLAVSTIPDFKTNAVLVKHLRKSNPKSIIICNSNNAREAVDLYSLGASYVVMPHYLGAKYASRMISRFGFGEKDYLTEKQRHLRYLQRRVR